MARYLVTWRRQDGTIGTSWELVELKRCVSLELMGFCSCDTHRWAIAGDASA